MCACSKNKKGYISVIYTGNNATYIFINGRVYSNLRNGQTLRIKETDFDESIMVKNA